MDIEELHKNILGVVFNNKRELDRFVGNKIIKTELIKPYLWVPDENFTVRGEKLHWEPGTLSRISSQSTVTVNSLFEVIKKILNGNTKNIDKNQYEYLNPVLIMLYYNNLIENGYEFCKTAENYYELRHPKYEIMYKIRETLKIFIAIFSNKNLFEILPEERTFMLKNFVVGKEVRGTIYRYIDVYFLTSPRCKVLINIDKLSENKDIVFLKDIDMMSELNELIEHFYFNETETKEFMTQIYKKISQKCYKTNREKSIIFYLTLKNIPIECCRIFTTIYNSEDKINILEIKEFFKSIGFKKFGKILKTLEDEGEISVKEGFINMDDLTLLINYPRKEDWKFSSEFKKFYARFMKEYFEFINDNLGNNDIKIHYLKHALITNKKYNTIHKIVKYSFLRYLDVKIKDKKLSFEIHPTVPILVREKGSKICKKNLLEKIYGLDLKFGETIKEHKEYDNNLYLDIKYRIDKIESKDYILNYRLINACELSELCH